MAMAIAAVVTFGFSRTVDQGLIHPKFVVPAALYIHVGVFVGWILFLIAQTTLVQMRQVRLHRILGWGGLGFAGVLVASGVWVALVMAGIEAREGDADAGAFLIVPFMDMVNFSVLFTLGALRRNDLEAHRRLMIMAGASLTGAAFSRFPAYIIPHGGWYYLAVDLLIGIGVLRDLIVDRRVHPVYVLGVPALMTVQLLTYFVLHAAWWAKASRGLIP